MAVEVWVKNYQSIREAHIVIEGFTVISGPNNSGKSALMRALRGPFENTPLPSDGQGYVRHGADFCSVKYKFPDGRTIEWRKGPKIKPTYIFDEDEDNPIYPGKEVPPQVFEMARVAPVETTSGLVWPQIAKQFTGQVFLVDKPGSAVADAISDVERVGALNKGLKGAEKDGRKATSTLKVRRGDQKRQQKELEHFEGLDEVSEGVEGVEAKVRHIRRVHQGVETLESLKVRLEGNRETVRVLEGVEDIEVPTAERFTTVLREGKECEELEELREELEEATAAVRRLEGVGAIDVPPMEKLAAIRDMGGKVEVLARLRARMEQHSNAVEALAGISDVEVLEACRLDQMRTMRGELKDLLDLRIRMQRAAQQVEEWGPLDAIESPLGLLSIEQAGKVREVLSLFVGLREKLREGQAQVSDLERSVKDRGRDLEAQGGKVSKLLSALPGCPTCGRNCKCGGAA